MNDPGNQRPYTFYTSYGFLSALTFCGFTEYDEFR